jgi:hypothetical protein
MANVGIEPTTFALNEICDMDVDKNIVQSENTHKIEVQIDKITNHNEQLAEIVTDNSVPGSS